MIVRIVIAVALIAAGILMFALATAGVYKFKYVLNRMHIAAQSDTLGLLFVLSGVAVLTGLTFATLKIVVIIILFWLTSPVSSHMIAKMEIDSKDKDDADRYEEIYEEGTEDD